MLESPKFAPNQSPDEKLQQQIEQGNGEGQSYVGSGNSASPTSYNSDLDRVNAQLEKPNLTERERQFLEGRKSQLLENQSQTENPSQNPETPVTDQASAQPELNENNGQDKTSDSNVTGPQDETPRDRLEALKNQPPEDSQSEIEQQLPQPETQGEPGQENLPEPESPELPDEKIQGVEDAQGLENSTPELQGDYGQNEISQPDVTESPEVSSDVEPEIPPSGATQDLQGNYKQNSEPSVAGQQSSLDSNDNLADSSDSTPTDSEGSQSPELEGNYGQDAAPSEPTSIGDSGGDSGAIDSGGDMG